MVGSGRQSVHLAAERSPARASEWPYMHSALLCASKSLARCGISRCFWYSRSFETDAMLGFRKNCACAPVLCRN